MLADKSNRTIVNLVNFETGLEQSSHSLLSKDEESVFKLRRLVEEGVQSGNPIFGCGSCGQPVVVRSHRIPSGKHTFYFKHLHASGDCPIKTDSTYTRDEVRRMKYNGAKESEAHYKLKNYLAEQIKRDDRFSDIKVEKVIKGSGWSRSWKKPDVSAVFNGKPVVFEIQLSTTFLDVIVSREKFYQNEGVSIFWIFNNLNPKSSRATEKDVYFNNKSNALSINDQSKKLSLGKDELVFIGHYKKPYIDEMANIVSESWEQMPVGFDDMEFDEETLKPYFIVFDSQYEKVFDDLREAEIAEIVETFESIVLQDGADYPRRRECASRLVEFDLYDNGKDLYLNIINLSKALLSIRDGRVYFPNQEGKWTWLVNYVYEHHLKYWLVFLFAVDAYGRADIVFDSSNEKLNRKREEFKNNWTEDSKYKQDTVYYSLFSVLLPELAKPLKKLSRS